MSRDPVKPTEQSGGASVGEAEAQKKGPWAATAAEGLIPAELGGAEASEEIQGDDPELSGAVLGQTTGSDEPATEEGVDLGGGDHADAIVDGGPVPTAAKEPDLRDAASGGRQVDKQSAE